APLAATGHRHLGDSDRFLPEGEGFRPNPGATQIHSDDNPRLRPELVEDWPPPAPGAPQPLLDQSGGHQLIHHVVGGRPAQARPLGHIVAGERAVLPQQLENDRPVELPGPARVDPHRALASLATGTGEAGGPRPPQLLRTSSTELTSILLGVKKGRPSRTRKDAHDPGNWAVGSTIKKRA